MYKKRIIIVIAICIVLVTVLAIIHNVTRVKVPKNCIKVEYDSNELLLDINDIDTIEVSGRVENQKNEVKEIKGGGVLLADVVAGYCTDYSKVTVIADDEYYAVLDAEELKGDCEAYLLITESEARLYVFSDELSKRNVSNVKRIIINCKEGTAN